MVSGDSCGITRGWGKGMVCVGGRACGMISSGCEICGCGCWMICVGECVSMAGPVFVVVVVVVVEEAAEARCCSAVC